MFYIFVLAMLVSPNRLILTKMSSSKKTSHHFGELASRHFCLHFQVTVSSAATVSEANRFKQVEQLLQCFPNNKNKTSSNTSMVRLSPLTLEQDPHLFELRRCRFLGSPVFGAVGMLHHFKGEVEALDTNSRETQGWLTPYNIRHNYSSPWRLTETVSTHAYLIKALKEYSKTVSKVFQPTFDNATVRNSLSSIK